MHIVVQHRITDPEKFFSMDAEEVAGGGPPSVQGQQFFPSQDGSVAACLWEADSIDTLRTELARVRTQGWALVNQELEEGLRAIAAPVRAPSGRVVAAVNVSAHATRTLESMRRDLVPPLLAAAARISADLPADGLGHVGGLAVPVRSRLFLNETPAVGQLESVLQENEPIGVLTADRQRARLFLFELGELVEHSELFEEVPRETDTRGTRDRRADQHGESEPETGPRVHGQRVHGSVHEAREEQHERQNATEARERNREDDEQAVLDGAEQRGQQQEERDQGHREVLRHVRERFAQASGIALVVHRPVRR